MPIHQAPSHVTRGREHIPTKKGFLMFPVSKLIDSVLTPFKKAVPYDSDTAAKFI
jgi:NAD+ synthase